MLKVKVTDQPYLRIPRSLSEELGLSDDDQVEVGRLGQFITLRKLSPVPSSKSLRSLAGTIKSSRPTGSVDISVYMNKRGYEYLDDAENSDIR